MQGDKNSIAVFQARGDVKCENKLIKLIGGQKIKPTGLTDRLDIESQGEGDVKNNFLSFRLYNWMDSYTLLQDMEHEAKKI